MLFFPALLLNTCHGSQVNWEFFRPFLLVETAFFPQANFLLMCIPNVVMKQVPLLNHCLYFFPTFYQNSESKTSFYTPRQMPRVVAPAKLAPKLHSSPLVWSQGSVRLQSSFSCLAQTLQQPQPSRTTLTPGAQWGISSGHSHMAGQEERTCTANNKLY